MKLPKDEKKQKSDARSRLWFIFFALLPLVFWSSLFFMNDVERIPYSEFLTLIDQDEIATLVIGDSILSGESKPDSNGKVKRFSTNAVKNEALLPKLISRGIKFRAENSNSVWSFIFTWILPGLIFYWIWSFATGQMNRHPGGILSLTKSKAKVFMEKDVKTTFSDVAGIDEAKEELQEIVNFLQDPTRYTRLGGRSPKGVLLVGPPGTGKTLLARALAGEARVPFFSINGSEFVELYVGLGAARVRDLFDQARKQAPCILFIDEIDAMGKSRVFGIMGSGTNDEKEQTLNQLLAEMDGFDSSEGVIMLAATNRPEILDPALLRAGRFDRQILLHNPDQTGRQQILAVHGKKIKLDPAVELEKIASLTSGFSGADLANVVNEAALVATRRGGDSVTNADFTQAIERVIAGLEQKGKVMNSKEKERIAYHELGHATVALDLCALDRVHKVSIIPRGMGALGYTLQRPTEDRFVLDEGELLDKVAVFLGGRAAEKLFLGKVSTGASDDLAKATDLARAMVAQFGMSERMGLVSYEARRSAYLQNPFEATGRSLSEKTASEIDEEVKDVINLAFQKSMECLNRNKAFIGEAHRRLLQVETLGEEEITALWGKFAHPVPKLIKETSVAKQL